MKKKVLNLILLLFLIFPIYVFGMEVSNVNFQVTNVYVNANVDILGSMHIQEAIVVKGALNGYERKINYKNPDLKEWTKGSLDFSNSSFYNGRNITVSKVYSYKVEKDDISFNVLNLKEEVYTKVDSAEKGETGVYTVTEDDNGQSVRIFNPNDKGYVVYVIDYYVDQIVKLHNDVAEVYWNFIPKDFDDIGKAEIQLTLPSQCTSDTFRFWAHGALNGEISAISQTKDEEGNELYRGVYAKCEDIKGSGIDIRMTFDSHLMSIAKDILDNSGEDGLDAIIEVETGRANDANAQRQQFKRIYYIVMALSIIYLVILIVLWIIIYKKYDKEFTPKFKGKYYREFIDDYPVETVEYLMNKKTTTNSFSASIMNMVYKKNLEIKPHENDKNDYYLVLKDENGLSENEKLITDLLFNNIAKGKNTVSLKSIKKYSKAASTCEKFYNNYKKWENCVTNNSKEYNMYINTSSIKGAGTIYFILGLILIYLITTVFKVEAFILSPIIFISSLIFLIYVLSFKKRSEKANEDYSKYKGFKNFLNDFGNLKEKEVPEIKLWEKYLVYATIFGISQKVLKAMQVKLITINEYDNTLLPNYFYYRTFNINRNINNTVASSVSSARSAISAKQLSQYSNSSSSSGSGFGGGFSSGGGFGGGGGSGHGF